VVTRQLHVERGTEKVSSMVKDQRSILSLCNAANLIRQLTVPTSVPAYCSQTVLDRRPPHSLAWQAGYAQNIANYCSI